VSVVYQMVHSSLRFFALSSLVVVGFYCAFYILYREFDSPDFAGFASPVSAF
jgi:hypothetical protein